MTVRSTIIRTILDISVLLMIILPLGPVATAYVACTIIAGYGLWFRLWAPSWEGMPGEE